MDIQFKKGVIELCVLSMLMQGDMYGYELSSVLSQEINISDGGIYPVLRRLKTDKYLDTYLKESNEGPPRKYYKLTNTGETKRVELSGDWTILKTGIDKIVLGGDCCE